MTRLQTACGIASLTWQHFKEDARSDYQEYRMQCAIKRRKPVARFWYTLKKGAVTIVVFGIAAAIQGMMMGIGS